MTRAGFLCLFVLAPLPALAQAERYLTADIGGGFSSPVYSTGGRLQNGWNFGMGVGVRPFPYLGVKVDFGYNQLDVNRATLNNLHFPNGDMRIFSFTLDPIIHVNPRGPVDFYLVGGAGVYHRTIEFTAPTGAIFTGFDPFFGFFYPVGVPANQVLASQTTVKPGVNGGAGFQFGFRHTIKFFAEARYHNMYTRGRDTTWVPVTFGFRW
jgi:opacity protein-like surface antigen